MTRYFSVNEAPYSVRCVLYTGDNGAFDKAVICCHGFAGHKGNAAAKRLSDYMLRKGENTAVLCFDLPCHGDDVRKKLRLEDCLAYLNTVVRYTQAELHDAEPCLYATSFGGYLALNYVAEQGNPFHRIALRCPAVNMYEILTNRIMSETDRALLAKGKSVESGFDRKITVDPVFVDSLLRADLSRLDYSALAGNALILHGTKDEIVSFHSVKSFAEANQIDFIPILNADHRFVDPGKMQEAIAYIDAFFDF